MNKITIIGSLGKDPEVRTVQSGNTVCSFSVAVTERYKGENKTTWFRVSAWNKLGENCAKYLSKGKKCAVVGSVSVSTYDGKDGKTHFSLDIFAENVEFLSPKTEPSDADETAPPDSQGYREVDDDDLPF
jgi:single-strand DNA-binding protein